MIVKYKLKGMATKKNEIFGKFRRGGISSKISFIDYLNEITVFEGETNEYKIENVKLPAIEPAGTATTSSAPVITRNASTNVAPKVPSPPVITTTLFLKLKLMFFIFFLYGRPTKQTLSIHHQ